MGSPTSQMIAAAKVVKKAIPAGQDNEAEAPIHPADGHGDPVFEDEPRELPALGEPPPEVSEVSRPPETKKIPDTVSKAEYDSHMLTHVPLRNWCEHCMAGKVHEDAHPRRAKAEVEFWT